MQFLQLQHLGGETEADSKVGGVVFLVDGGGRRMRWLECWIASIRGKSQRSIGRQALARDFSGENVALDRLQAAPWLYDTAD